MNIKKIAIIGCGAYMDCGYGCPGEWRCLKAAALGEDNIKEKASVIALIKCQCPGRSLIANTGMAMKLSEINPDTIYLSSCLANAKPGCPYYSTEEMVKIMKGKTGIKVIPGTHDYH